MIKTVLLPGGIGYIGSHIVVDLLEKTPHDIVILDNYFNSDKDALSRIIQAVQFDVGKQKSLEMSQRLQFYENVDVRDLQKVKEVFEIRKLKNKPIHTVIHLAAKKCAPESVQFPFDYFENNFIGTMNILKAMEQYNDCTQLLISSTAAVYGDQDNCTQKFECLPISPYGESKLCMEMLLKSMARARKDWKILSLRYFNPAGNHKSGKIGDYPSGGFPANLFPVIQEVIIGMRQKIVVYGDDYETVDGTGVRDYIHVCDLSNGHMRALNYFERMTDQNYNVFNLGSQNGQSVLQVLKMFEKVMGKKINYQIGSRRPGDMKRLVAVSEKAHKVLGWKAQRGLKDMCESCVAFTNNKMKKTLTSL